jgi:hypothetical protein
METVAYLLEKAAQCRRLAAAIPGDNTAEALIELAKEYEAKAGGSPASAPLTPSAMLPHR